VEHNGPGRIESIPALSVSSIINPPSYTADMESSTREIPAGSISGAGH